MHRALFDLKNTDGGQALLSWIKETIEDLQYNLDLKANPNDAGAVGVLIGQLRAYHALEEILRADYVDEKDQ